MAASSWLYVNAQTSVTLGALLYVYLCHNRRFYFVRNMFLIAMAIALVGYVVFPTAPPRFFPEWGFVDSGGRFHRGQGVGGEPGRYRALQPLRGGSLDARRLRADGGVANRPPPADAGREAAWLVYPLLITFVIVVTANHFLVDAVLGAVTA